MEIVYKKDGNRNTMIIKNAEINADDYKYKMVLHNKIDRIMPIIETKIDDEIELHYDLTSKTSLASMYQRRQMTGKEMYSFIKDIKSVGDKLEEFLLDNSNIMYHPDYIFYNKQTGKYEFCYIPGTNNDFYVQIRELFDKFLEYINHNDKEAVGIAYGIQQITIGGDFTITDLYNCGKEVIERYQKINEEPKEVVPVVKLDEAQKEKTGILTSFFNLFKKKDEYKDEKELVYETLNDNYVVSEDVNYSEEATVLLTANQYTTSIRLVGTNTEIPVCINVDDYPYIVGKSKCSCNFCIDSAVVSRVHMRITNEQGDFYLEDLNSTNGTYVNGNKIKAHELVQINIGDLVSIANIDFIVE